MSRFIVTIADTDPTLAAQAHAAIVAVPGVVGVEEHGVRSVRDGEIVIPLGGEEIVVPFRREDFTVEEGYVFQRADSARVEAPVVAAPPVYVVCDEEDGDP